MNKILSVAKMKAMATTNESTNLYDVLDEDTRDGFLGVIGVDSENVDEATAREILAGYDTTAVEEARAHNFI